MGSCIYFELQLYYRYLYFEKVRLPNKWLLGKSSFLTELYSEKNYSEKIPAEKK